MLLLIGLIMEYDIHSAFFQYGGAMQLLPVISCWFSLAFAWRCLYIKYTIAISYCAYSIIQTPNMEKEGEIP